MAGHLGHIWRDSEHVKRFANYCINIQRSQVCSDTSWGILYTIKLYNKKLVNKH